MYLRRFADADEQLVARRTESGSDFPISVSNAAVQIGFYDVQNSATAVDQFEKILAMVVGAAKGAFDAIDAGVWPLSRKHRSDLGYFVAMQLVRGESFRDTYRDNMDRLYRRFLVENIRRSPEELRRIVGHQPGVKDVDQEVAAIVEDLEQGELRVEPDKSHAVATAFKVGDELFSDVYRMAWELQESVEPALVTCDTPVLMWPSSGLGFPIQSAKQATLPLGPHLALVLSHDKRREGRRSEMTENQLEILRRGALQAAHRFAFTHPEVAFPAA